MTISDTGDYLMIYLKQSTASQKITIGPFLDDTDGKTAETALTIANTDLKIWKAGSTTLASKNSGGATHISGGIYSAVLDATDTDTLGSGSIYCQVPGALPCVVRFTVLPANVFDALVSGSDLLQVDTTQVGGTTATPTEDLATAASLTQIEAVTTKLDAMTESDGSGGYRLKVGALSQAPGGVLDNYVLYKTDPITIGTTPTAGVLVTAFRDLALTQPEREAYTGADGTASIWLAPGTYYLRFLRAGLTISVVEVTVS